jgi:glycosyltransferase involved in cell wall biosynthesis
MGRICDLKGADRVANAIQIIEQNHDFEAPILFVGDGNMRTELEAKLESNNVRFTGWLPKRDALRFLADSKLFLLPSRSEGLPKALLEAMARGTVPIVTPVGDMPDVVSNDNGYILEDPRPERLANTILKALKTDQTKKSNQAIETIRKEHSYERAKHDFEKLIGYTDSPPQE